MVRNPRRGATLGRAVGLADRWWLRLRGLLGRPPLRAGEGLLLVPCRGVHTLGMREPLDIAILDRRRTVIAVYPSLPPGRGTPLHRRGVAVLELPAGTLALTGTVPGDPLEWADGGRVPMTGAAA